MYKVFQRMITFHDQSQRSELILPPLAVTLAKFAASAVENRPREFLPVFTLFNCVSVRRRLFSSSIYVNAWIVLSIRPNSATA